MPPKKSRKRKATSTINDIDNSDRSTTGIGTWPGWVEMESEPAFFNVMLQDMGVTGATTHEVYSLDRDMLATLPQPIRALIFLFKYKDFSAEQQEEVNCPSHIWFANQVPDFACASIALLNILNNVPGLKMGREMQEFALLTKTMTPLERGNAIDSFDFIRNIHNSFAREVDILNANMYLHNKAAKTRKRTAAMKAAATRRTNAKQSDTVRQPTSGSMRISKASSRPNRCNAELPVHKPGSSPPLDVVDNNRLTTSSQGSTSEADGVPQPNFNWHVDHPERCHSPSVRRSARAPQPRKDLVKYDASKLGHSDAEDEGYHFIAYMPIGDHVWKLDGMDAWPTDLGSFTATQDGSWLDIAQPALQARMLQYAADEIHFNLMAVSQDPLTYDKQKLITNVNALVTLEHRLDAIDSNWREMEGCESIQDLLNGPDARYGITQNDINSAILDHEYSISDDTLHLVERWRALTSHQSLLRTAVQETIRQSQQDNLKALHRRHDYYGFLKSWLAELAEREILTSLLEDL